MTETFVLLIEKHNHCTLDQILQDLRIVYPNVDHMRGFVEGYCFGKAIILPLLEYQNRTNSDIMRPPSQNNWVVFLHVETTDSED